MNSCPRHPDILRPPNVSVSWCYKTNEPHITGIGEVAFCIDTTTGRGNASYSIGEMAVLEEHIRDINVLDDGRLYLPEASFSILLRYADINCTVSAESGGQLQQCGVDEFSLTVLNRKKSELMFISWCRFQGNTVVIMGFVIFYSGL
jgi:hypothetical protein